MKKYFYAALIIFNGLFSSLNAQWTTGSNLIYYNGGNVGIGTTSPQDKLHITGGNLRLDNGYEMYFSDNGQIRSLDDNHRILFRRSVNKLELREYGDIIFSPGAYYGVETAKMVFLQNGNVGIGTTTPQAKLAVNGEIYSKKVKVTQSGWPDYVFHTTYRLRPLSEVEQYIQLNHHLPEVSSAAEVERDGIDLGDNQATLLKKIEELTLYIINLNKEVEALKKEIRQKGSN